MIEGTLRQAQGRSSVKVLTDKGDVVLIPASAVCCVDALDEAAAETRPIPAQSPSPSDSEIAHPNNDSNRATGAMLFATAGAGRLAASVAPRHPKTVAAWKVPSSRGEQDGERDGAPKAIKDVMPAPSPHWVGDGFYVYPVFNQLAFTNHVSPFLMFDYAAPKHFKPTNRRHGVGKHPHRGFETVTIAFQGEVEHSDNVGNHGVIGPGDVQWMTAGRGIVHEEHHSDNFSREGGTFEMCQLWVNLPKEHKMSKPRYQPILKEDIPQVPLVLDDTAMAYGHVRIIAGSYMGVRGPAKTFTPINVWDILLKTSGWKTDLQLPAGHTTLIFVRRGSVKVGAKDRVGPQGMVRLDAAGCTVRLEATEPGTQLLLLGGEPIDEPIAAQGPFVMNTQAELVKANVDFRSGRLGR